MKKCSKCKIEKPLSAFSKNRKAKDRLQNQCKSCFAEQHRSSTGEKPQKSNYEKQPKIIIAKERQPKITNVAENKAGNMPKVYRNSYLVAISGEANPRGAIQAFCIECMGYDRAEVTNCNTTDCPLNPYRPYMKADDGD